MTVTFLDKQTEALNAAIEQTTRPVCVELFDCSLQDPPTGEPLYRNEEWMSATYVLTAGYCQEEIDNHVGAGGAAEVLLNDVPEGCHYHIRVFPCLIETKVYRPDPERYGERFVQQIGPTLYTEYAWA